MHAVNASNHGGILIYDFFVSEKLKRVVNEVERVFMTIFHY
jgi:hypothetical protein